MHGSNGDTDIENRLMDMGWGAVGRKERVGCMESHGNIHYHM